MKVSVKKYKVYELLTLGLLIGSVLLVTMSWWFVFLTLSLIVQYEIVNFNVSVILRQYVMLKQKKISELKYSKFQLVLKHLFGI